MGGVFRIIPTKILTAEQLGLVAGDYESLRFVERFGRRHRTDRIGKINDALRDG